MKFKKILAILSTTLISLSNTTFAKEEANMSPYHQVTESTMINMTATSIERLESLLIKGAEIVKQTEPNTKSWFALKECKDKFYIFDVFPDEAGRSEHFNGKVAHALKENAEEIVKNGWQQGVVNNIHNGMVLSSKLANNNAKMKVANYISFEAKPGYELNVANLLKEAAKLVDQTEPKTSAWFAIQLSSSKFAIFDAFEDEQGQKAHFEGNVAAALYNIAETHLVGGWEKGVVQNIKNLKVITTK